MIVTLSLFHKESLLLCSCVEMLMKWQYVTACYLLECVFFFAPFSVVSPIVLEHLPTAAVYILRRAGNRKDRCCVILSQHVFFSFLRLRQWEGKLRKKKKKLRDSNLYLYCSATCKQPCQDKSPPTCFRERGWGGAKVIPLFWLSNIKMLSRGDATICYRACLWVYELMMENILQPPTMRPS